LWAPDASALWFFSWQDQPGADFAKAIRDTALPPPGSDRLQRLAAPFTGPAATVAASELPMDDMGWAADGRVLLVWDGYEPRRVERLWWIDPAKPAAKTVLYRRTTESVYGHPGAPLWRYGRQQKTVWTTRDGAAVYMAGSGFRPDGQRPFLATLDLATGRTNRLFESTPEVLETVGALLADDGSRFVTLQQTSRVPPNYFLRVAGSNAAKRLSDYPHPAPALAGIQRIAFTFMRPDSVRLNAEAVLPAGWQPGQRLPTVFWVYPSDYRSATAASENRRSPNRFPSKSPLNPEVLLTQGYAVVYPDLAIVGTNDQYVEDLAVSARAAVDEAVRRGFCDRDRIGVGGHSYGAFATANLLAHTDLFKAGVASDGAYNRTLTPFTFQTEQRNLWEARDMYLKVSPFLSADRIDEPLLLLHNLDDTNVGTNPIQSERMFEALNGLGKTVTLIEYPYEDHGPAARETVLDYWARVIEWMDRYVKNGRTAGAAAATSTPAPAAP
jgi:dipeptidyl aminopeptidase/acylaminoacyl peptidase